MTSPIETRLLQAILVVAPQLHITSHVCFGWKSLDEESVDHPSDYTEAAVGESVADIMIYPEAQVSGYRADLLMFLQMPHQEGVLNTALVVECDGHEWHERTQQQAAYDRARDRALLRGGLSTIRFTGSEIHRDANQCAREVLEVVGALHACRIRDIAGFAGELARKFVAKAVEHVDLERAKKDGG